MPTVASSTLLPSWYYYPPALKRFGMHHSRCVLFLLQQWVRQSQGGVEDEGLFNRLTPPSPIGTLWKGQHCVDLIVRDQFKPYWWVCHCELLQYFISLSFRAERTQEYRQLGLWRVCRQKNNWRYFLFTMWLVVLSLWCLVEPSLSWGEAFTGIRK